MQRNSMVSGNAVSMEAFINHVTLKGESGNSYKSLLRGEGVQRISDASFLFLIIFLCASWNLFCLLKLIFYDIIIHTLNHYLFNFFFIMLYIAWNPLNSIDIVHIQSFKNPFKRLRSVEIPSNSLRMHEIFLNPWIHLTSSKFYKYPL